MSNTYTFNKNNMSFIHIPKSAGTSLGSIINKYNLPIRYGAHEPISNLCPPGMYKYILIIRDPISRVISYYNMVKRNGKNYPYNKYTSSMSIFLQNCFEVRNLMTLYLSGLTVDELRDKYNNVVGEEIYNIALSNLKQVYKVIIFEQFAEQITDFIYKEFNISILSAPHERRVTEINNIPIEDINIIKQYNQYDIKLWDYARSHYIV